MRAIAASLLPCLLLVVPGCATRQEPDWQAADATAYGTAETICTTEADARSPAERDMAYSACMTRQGRTRSPREDDDARKR